MAVESSFLVFSNENGGAIDVESTTAACSPMGVRRANGGWRRKYCARAGLP